IALAIFGKGKIYNDYHKRRKRTAATSDIATPKNLFTNRFIRTGRYAYRTREQNYNGFKQPVSF
ncbi:MAG: hypothetical protein LUD27_06440, partial [Clostridia bacterium]|nr:hypothetical protein [Clostridia bacterium]